MQQKPGRQLAGFLVLTSLLMISGCAGHQTRAGDHSLSQLATWMSGAFSSEQQSIDDERYFHITLRTAAIWTEREDGPWLYVEQATASRPQQPYRQRVYHLTQENGLFISTVYSLPTPVQHVGAWQNPDSMDHIGPDDLQERTGCAVFLKPKDDASYRGATDADACQSSLRGASYATSEVTVTANAIDSWDRGFDAEGNQVWGAEAGAYLFRRE